MKRAAIYCRVSTRPQAEGRRLRSIDELDDERRDGGTSLDTQEDACRRHAVERGFVISEEHVYHEIFTGTELWDRPQLTRLRDAIRRQAVDVVICYAIDRLARDPVHLGVVLSEADHKRVAVEFVTEVLDDSPEGQLIRFVRGYAAKVEHEKIRERSIRGKRARVESGKLLAGAPDLYGYRLDRERGIREIHEPEARIVRLIFTWYTEEGIAINDVARRLNAQGVPVPSTGKWAYAGNRTPRWNDTSVRRILIHEAYVGESWAWKYRYNRAKTGVELRPRDEWIALPDGTTPAIVDRDAWTEAQRRLAINKGEKARNKARPCLLRGMIFCAVCGRRLWVDRKHGRLYYRCPAPQVTGEKCAGVIVQAAPVEAWAWEEVCRRLRDPSIIERERASRRGIAGDDSLDAQLRAIRQRVSQIVHAQERVLARYSESDSVPWELIEREITRMETEKAELRDELTRLEARRVDRDRDRQQTMNLTAWAERVAGNLETLTFDEKRKVLEVLAVRVLASGFDYTITVDPGVF